MLQQAKAIASRYVHLPSTMTSTYTYISAEELAKGWKERGCKRGEWAIVDVRDDDFSGGHIRGCWNVPSSEFQDRLPEVLKTLQSAKQVVFHCSLSQARGPKAARIYSEARHEAGKGGEQKICVLRDGFSQFGARYKADKELVEAYDEDAWKYR